MLLLKTKLNYELAIFRYGDVCFMYDDVCFMYGDVCFMLLK